MKIRMLQSIAGADFALSPGEVTERFESVEAARFVAAGIAEAADAAPVERTVAASAGEKRARKRG